MVEAKSIDYQGLNKHLEMKFTKVINNYSHFHVQNTVVNDAKNILFRYPESRKVNKWGYEADKKTLKKIQEDIELSISHINTFIIMHSDFLSKITKK